VTPLSLNQLLTLYAWFPLATLLLFLLLIGRFYQKFSGERTFFRMFTVPILLFGTAAVRYASINAVMGDWIGDVLLASAGISLLCLSTVLYRRMTIGR
jgi:hypothetical protein